jgi:hypothetical protein
MDKPVKILSTAQQEVVTLSTFLLEKTNLTNRQAYGCAGRWRKKYGYSLCYKTLANLPDQKGKTNPIPYITGILKIDYAFVNRGKSGQAMKEIERIGALWV